MTLQHYLDQNFSHGPDMLANAYHLVSTCSLVYCIKNIITKITSHFLKTNKKSWLLVKKFWKHTQLVCGCIIDLKPCPPSQTLLPSSSFSLPWLAHACTMWAFHFWTLLILYREEYDICLSEWLPMGWMMLPGHTRELAPLEVNTSEGSQVISGS